VTRYPWLLFDADDTLFDYRRAEEQALAEAFGLTGIAYDPAWLAVYQRINAAAWRALEEGRTTSARLRVMRFEELADELALDLDPTTFAARYMERLAAQTSLVDGAVDTLAAVLPGRQLAIITNGIAQVQRPRVAASAIAGLVDHLVISEEVGAAKPDPAIFAEAMERMGRPERREVLVIGDSLSSDIAGGRAAGLDTCWYNPDGVARGSGPAPTYEIRRLPDLVPLLAGGTTADEAPGPGRD
jgi:2-haloacid dehalogenase